MAETNQRQKHFPNSADFVGSAMAAVQGLAMSIALGILVFSPLGPAVALSMGVQAGLVALVVGGCVTLLGGAPMSVSSPRAAGMVVLSGMVAFLARTQPDISPQAVALAVALCLAVSGLIQVVMAIVHIDRLLDRMPEPVLGGFTLVIGMLVVLDQLNPLLLGQYALRPNLLGVPDLLARAKGATPFIGLGVLALVVSASLLPKLWGAKKTPQWVSMLMKAGPLTGVLAGILAVWTLGAMLPAAVGAVVPTLGQTIPNFDPTSRSWWPQFTLHSGWSSAWHELSGLNSVGWLLAPAALIAVIHSLDALSTARMLRTAFYMGYNARRELVAQGLANFACGACGGIGVAATPGLSSALAAAGAGGRWGRVLLIAWVVLFVLGLWGVVSMLPIPVLGALVAATGVNMFVSNLHHLRLKSSPFSPAHLDQNLGVAVVWLMLVLAIVTPISVLWVVSLGAALTVLVWVYQSSGKLVFRQYSGVNRRSLEHRSPANDERLRDMGHLVKVLELEGDLFFGTAPLLRDHLLRAYPKQSEDARAQRHLVLDFSRLDQIDLSGLSSLESVLKTLCGSAKVKVWLSYVPQHLSLLRHLKHSGVPKLVGEERWLHDTELALEAIEDELLAHHSNEHEILAKPQSLMGCGLSDADWNTFHLACQPLTLTTNEVLFAPGDIAHHIYWLQEGDVHLMLPPLSADPINGQQHGLPNPRNHRQKRLAALNPGTWLGLDALIPSAQRSASAIANRPSQLLELPVIALQGWINTHPALAAAVFGNLAIEATERLVGAAKELVVVDA
jgi:SulP family sulfate permease